MGKWDRRNYARPRRRFYRDYNWSPPRDEPIPDPETEVWQDNVPMWEKKFCYLVGRMPWKKVLATKNFMNCQSNVLSWDDSAGKEAFSTAKKRFWEEFNALPCETQLPNPDLYIDQIDWNPYIDPDLMREADQLYFNPDDKYYLPSTRSNKIFGQSDDVDDPWERDYVQINTEKNNASGWNQQDNSCNDASKLNNDDNPWESHNTHENGATKDNATGWNQWDNSVNHTNEMKPNNDPWERHNTQGTKAVMGNTWGGEWNNNSWEVKPNLYTGTPNRWRADSSSWRKEGSEWQDRGGNSRNWNQQKGEPPKTSYWSDRNRPQEYGSQRGTRVPNGRGNHWGQKPRDKYNWGLKDSINIHRNQGQFNPGSRKRGSPDQYVANQKDPRLQGDGGPSNYWDGGHLVRSIYIYEEMMSVHHPHILASFQFRIYRYGVTVILYEDFLAATKLSGIFFADFIEDLLVHLYPVINVRFVHVYSN